MDEEAEDTAPVNWRPWFGWALVAPFVLWAIARTFGLENGFPSVQVMAYTPYALLLSLLALLVVVLLRQWLPFLLGLLAFIALGIAVVPRELGRADRVEGGTEINLMSFNMLKGKANQAELRDLIEARGIDVLSLQEVTADAAAEIKAGPIARLLPHSTVIPGGAAPGGAIYSRYPLTAEGAPPTEMKQPDALIEVPGAIPFRIRSVHPAAPTGPRSTPDWNADYEYFPPARDPGPPQILAGDFNASLDHQNLRDLIGTGYRDVADTIGQGLVSTWPSRFKWPLPVTIDHVLTEKPVAITGYDVEKIAGSDHRAIFADLNIPDS